MSTRKPDGIPVGIRRDSKRIPAGIQTEGRRIPYLVEKRREELSTDRRTSRGEIEKCGKPVDNSVDSRISVDAHLTHPAPHPVTGLSLCPLCPLCRHAALTAGAA